MRKLLLVLCLCVSLPLALYADFTQGNFTYSVKSGNTVSVKASGTGISGVIEIPSTVTNDGTTYTVVEIASGGFYNCPNITAVGVPGTVTKINGGAFASCPSLVYIAVFGTDVTIDKQWLSSTTNVETVKLACNLNSRMFSDYSKLKTVELTGNITEIPSECFSGCTALENITIPSTVTNIEEKAFIGCSSLTVTIPEGA